MKDTVKIGNREVGPGHPVYVIAEMSANHAQDFDRAVALIDAAKESGADAVKLQTYTADTMTIDCDADDFRIKGTMWEGRNLHELYREAYTPWEWQPRLKAHADRIGIDLFSTPFDASAVEFLEDIDVAAFKIASFEVVDIPLLRCVAKTGRPIIMSTGMATLSEIDEAVTTLREAGATELVLLKCTSSYPASYEEMDLRTIPNLADTFDVPVGLSDHTMHVAVPVAAVALGACVLEKHFTLSRSEPGPDSAFSLEPQELKETIEAVRAAEKALGMISYLRGEGEEGTRALRRSLYVVEDVKKGERFSHQNVRSIRPGHGLHTRHLEEVVGRVATCDISRGARLTWGVVGASDS